MEAENSLRDDSQRSQRPRSQFGQIVTGDILHHLAATLGQRSIGQRECDADD